METGEVVSRTQWNPQQVLLVRQGYRESEVCEENPVFVRLDERDLIYEVMSKDWRPVTVAQTMAAIQTEVGRRAS